MRFFGFGISDEEKRKRESLSYYLHVGQYAGLIFSAYQLYQGKLVSATVCASTATLLEKIAATIYKNILEDTGKADYINSHLSGLSTLPKFFQPFKNKAVSAIRRDIENLTCKKV